MISIVPSLGFTSVTVNVADLPLLVMSAAFSAALVAAAVTFTSCRNNEQTVYGPPPQDYDASSNVEADVYGAPVEEYDASSNMEEDVYGPPPEETDQSVKK